MSRRFKGADGFARDVGGDGMSGPRGYRDVIQVLRRQVTGQQRVPARERLRAAFGALLGILITALIGYLIVGADSALPWVIAPMGASAVLLFAAPASPLAQPWAMLGGNLSAAVIGVACAAGFRDPLMASAVAVSVAIVLMFVLRCIHPPAGAVALTAVVGGPAIHALGYGFVLYPVLVNSATLLLLAVVYNRATGREYPQRHAVIPVGHQADATPDPARLLADEDLEAVLDEYDQVLDVSREDLRDLFLRLERHATLRRLAAVRCADVMTRNVVSVQFGTALEDAWALLQRHHIKALPVVDPAHRVIGIVTLADFMRNAGRMRYHGLNHRLKRLIGRSGRTHGDKPEVVGQIMNRPVHTAARQSPVTEVIALFTAGGHSHVPVIDEHRRLVGIVVPRDLVAAYAREHLAPVQPGR